MNLSDERDPTSAEFEVFISALSEVFHDESWEDVERYAARAWNDCGFNETTPWASVKERLRDGWIERFDSVIGESRRLRYDLALRMREARSRSDELMARVKGLRGKDD